MAAHPLRSASSTAARFALDRLEHVREGARVSHLQPRILCLGGVGRSMTKQDVRQLVRHHADDLGFRRRRVEHAALHEHRPARQRKGIDLLEVHRRERILVDRLVEFRRCGRDQAISQRGQIARDLPVLDDRIPLPNLCCGFAAERDILLGRVFVFGELDRGLSENTVGRRAQNQREEHDTE
jgi:hypothetical protein